MTNIELLAPAGTKESFYASINAGANAIYLGGKLFSARAYASNFTNDELLEMVNYAHLRNVKIYITVNTIIFEEEFNDAIKFIKYLHSINVDGVLLQDLGLAYYLHQVLPNLVLHASTQLNCHNVSEAKALIDLGFKRIVLARETPLNIVKEIKDLGVEVEVFVHGALCVSYSGQCLMSSLIGNRSGNRGKCAQPCRNYMKCIGDDNKESKDFAISMKDLCTLDHINDYIDVGVDSLKIEGRMKREEYVYEVVSSYRQGIDACINKTSIDTNKLVLDMKKLFNREFTPGFIFSTSRTKTLNQKTSSHIGEHLGYITSISKNYAFIKLDSNLSINDGIRINNKKQEGQIIQKMFVDSKDVKLAYKGQLVKILLHDIHPQINDEIIKTTSYEQIVQIDSLMKEYIKKINIDINLYAYINSPLKMEIKLFDINILKESEYIVQLSQNKEINIENLKNQINRLGNSDYALNNFKFIGDNNAFIPNSILNELRRISLEELDNILLKKKCVNDIVINEYKPSLKESNSSKDDEFNLSCQVESLDQLKVVLNYPFKKIIISSYSLFKEYSSLDNVYYASPRINELDYNSALNKEITPHIKEVNDISNKVIASPYMNVVNSYMVECLLNKNYSSIILSYELSKSRINSMMNAFYKKNNFYPKVSIPLYGYIDLMVMKSCPISSMYNLEKDHCNFCKKHHYVLMDRKNVSFEMMHDESCNTRILNSLPLYLLDRINELKSMHIYEGILYFTKESEDETKKICEHSFSKLNNLDLNKLDINTTLGHYLREIE